MIWPTEKLDPGTYTATVTVGPHPDWGHNEIAPESFDISFIVYTSSQDYDIFLSTQGTHTFPKAVVGYAAQTPLDVTVFNVGKVATGPLTIATGTTPSAFTVSPTGFPGILPGEETTTFTVTPNPYLSPGTYRDTVMVHRGGFEPGIPYFSDYFDVSFTVVASEDIVPEGEGCNAFFPSLFPLLFAVGLSLLAVKGLRKFNGR